MTCPPVLSTAGRRDRLRFTVRRIPLMSSIISEELSGADQCRLCLGPASNRAGTKTARGHLGCSI
jgi:hypothetical protein